MNIIIYAIISLIFLISWKTYLDARMREFNRELKEKRLEVFNQKLRGWQFEGKYSYIVFTIGELKDDKVEVKWRGGSSDVPLQTLLDKFTNDEWKFVAKPIQEKNTDIQG